MEWEDVAAKLLDKKLYLSALELYYELLEQHQEIPALRDFFSNPGNFETFYNIPRSTSLQTFDSLDLVSRYSDDDVNVADERVTVLEFELRKAQETINALRGTLTTSAAPEHKERSGSQGTSLGPLLPYEKRCLNFLISEYLLEQGYKLTAITYSEETGDQDLEDWEEVGLNCPRPPPLLGVYRTSDHHKMQSLEEKCKTLEEKCTALSGEMNSSISQITQLKKLLSEYEETQQKSPASSTTTDLVIVDEGNKPRKSGSDGNVFVYIDEVRTFEERNRRQISDCSMITQGSGDKAPDGSSVVGSMNSYSTTDDKRQEVEMCLADATRESPLPPPSSRPSLTSSDMAEDDGIVSATEDEDEDRMEEANTEVKEANREGEEANREVQEYVGEVDEELTVSGEGRTEEEDRGNASEADVVTLTLVCVSPTHGLEGEVELLTPVSDEVNPIELIPSDEVTETPPEDEEVVETDAPSAVIEPVEKEGETDAGEKAAVSDKLEDSDKMTESVESIPFEDESSSMSDTFTWCLRALVQGTVQHRLSEEISHIGDKPILVMGRCLPHIMPHVLLNKREELLPVILCLAVQHPDPAQRDSLLHLLFNLVKRPDFQQRQIIRAGCEAFARSVDSRRLQEELLPQCWEQISDKNVERRLLVAETCGTLSAHLSEDVCSSLLISILKQVLDDKDESVRECALKNLSLVITRVFNDHKTSELMHILTSGLHDPSSKVQETAITVYLPAVSTWLVSRDLYLVTCYYTLLKQLTQAVKSGSMRLTTLYLRCLSLSSVFILTSLLHPLVPSRPRSSASTCSIRDRAPSTPRPRAPSTPNCQAAPAPAARARAPTSPSLDRMSESTEETHLDLVDPCVILNLSRNQYTALRSELNTGLAQSNLPDLLQEQAAWFADKAVPSLVECIQLSPDRTISAGFTSLLVQLQRVTGRAFVQRTVRPGVYAHVRHAQVLPVYCAGILAAAEDERGELKGFLSETLSEYASQFLDVTPLTETFSVLSTNKGALHILVTVLNNSIREANNAHVKGIIAKICKGMCERADPSDVSCHVLPLLTRLANDPDVFVQTSTVASFAVMLQRCPGSVGSVREQLDKFISESVSADVHVMMCELIESFTLVLPLTNPDIQRDFLIPRLATIGVSNSTISNKTKRRDITERLISAYKAILCNYLTPDTIEHYIAPGLEALLTDCRDVAPDCSSSVEAMLREVNSKTSSLNKDARGSTVFGSKMSGFFKKK